MSDVEAKPKTSLWRRRLSSKGMFKAVGKLVISGATQDWTGVAGGLVDIADGLGFDADAGDQAGLLVTRALARALGSLLDPYKMGFDEDVATDAKGVAAAIDAELEATELSIEHSFLERPRELAILPVFQEKIVRWLEPVDIRGGREPASIAARLPEHFVYALHREASERHGDYDKLFAHFAGEFDDAYRRERSWAGYRAWFMHELAGSVLGDSFSLAQVFIWPRAYWVEEDEAPRGRRREAMQEPPKQRRTVGRLRELLDAWIDQRAPHDAVRVISGDPGAGKSSFARMFADHRMKKGERVLYVPLHLIDVKGELGASLARLCDEIPTFPKLSLEGDAAEAELLLILDGLDELSKRGHVGARLADEFVTEVLAKVDKYNYGGLRLRVLLSGRPIAVQGVEARFRKPGQLLHLLPFCTLESELRDDAIAWIDTDELLGEDLRDEWWRRYGAATGAGHEGLPEALRGEALVETTRQPLLGYLLALVHERAQAEGKTIEKDISRNEIYAQLIDDVYTREWGSPPGHPSSSKIAKHEFRELLEDMALAAWHDGERVTTVAAVEALQGGEQGVEKLRAYAESCDGVGQLFTAFYMRKHGEREQGEETFEFTHKSFAEYLTARRLVAQVELATGDLEARAVVSGGRRDRRSIKEVREILVDWLEIFGPVAISGDLLPYLRREVALRDADEPGTAKRWQLALIELIEYVLREGSPCERIERPLRFIEARAWARNAEEGLLALLSCCSAVTEEISEIKWPAPTSFGDWMRWLRDQPDRHYQYRTIAGFCLARLDLRGANLAGADLGRADLRRSNLENADLDSASLNSANLYSANLDSASLDSASLNHAKLDSASLNHAKLDSASLDSASLNHAKLNHAKLNYASLNYASLNYASLNYASLNYASLYYASLNYASLNYASLDSASLYYASLYSASLDYASLDSASLDSASLDSANLTGADLRGSSITPEQLGETRGQPAHLPGGD